MTTATETTTYASIRDALSACEHAAIIADRDYTHDGSAEGVRLGVVLGEVAKFWYNVRIVVAAVRDREDADHAAITALYAAVAQEISLAASAVYAASRPGSMTTRSVDEAIAIMEAVRAAGKRATAIVANWGDTYR